MEDTVTPQVNVLYAVCFMRCAVCCVLRAACCVLRAVHCTRCAACCVLRAVPVRTSFERLHTHVDLAILVLVYPVNGIITAGAKDGEHQTWYSVRTVLEVHVLAPNQHAERRGGMEGAPHRTAPHSTARTRLRRCCRACTSSHTTLGPNLRSTLCFCNEHCTTSRCF